MLRPRAFQIVSLLALLLILTGCTGRRAPKGSPLVFGVVNEIDSSALDEKRTLNIYLPPSYEETLLQTYPVIYLLDGAANEDYHHVSGLVQFLTMYKLMPESIVVGIANVDRYRDFTSLSTVPGDVKGIPNNGGSPTFRAFLETELQPFIDATYRTNDRKMIIGQSLGGLIAAEILVENTDLFDTYIIVSPSLWWNDKQTLSRFPEFLRNHPRLKKTVFLSVGTEGEGMNDLVGELAALFEKESPTTVKFQFLFLPGETHATVLHRSLYRAFEFLYGETHPGL